MIGSSIGYVMVVINSSYVNTIESGAKNVQTRIEQLERIFER